MKINFAYCGSIDKVSIEAKQKRGLASTKTWVLKSTSKRKRKFCDDHEYDIPTKHVNAYRLYAIKLALYQKRYAGIFEVKFYSKTGNLVTRLP